MCLTSAFHQYPRDAGWKHLLERSFNFGIMTHSITDHILIQNITQKYNMKCFLVLHQNAPKCICRLKRSADPSELDKWQKMKDEKWQGAGVREEGGNAPQLRVFSLMVGKLFTVGKSADCCCSRLMSHTSSSRAISYIHRYLQCVKVKPLYNVLIWHVTTDGGHVTLTWACSPSAIAVYLHVA